MLPASWSGRNQIFYGVGQLNVLCQIGRKGQTAAMQYRQKVTEEVVLHFGSPPPLKPDLHAVVIFLLVRSPHESHRAREKEVQEFLNTLALERIPAQPDRHLLPGIEMSPFTCLIGQNALHHPGPGHVAVVLVLFKLIDSSPICQEQRDLNL